MLGRAIQERFPRYYRYFSTRTFTFRGQAIGNHNRLLGRVEGVDGIKTGYIRASGFNLVTSVKRGQPPRRRGRAGRQPARGARDARMRELLSEHIDNASTRRTAPMVAEAPSSPTKRRRQRASRSRSQDRDEPKPREAPSAKLRQARAACRASPAGYAIQRRSVPARLAPTADPAARPRRRSPPARPSRSGRCW